MVLAVELLALALCLVMLAVVVRTEDKREAFAVEVLFWVYGYLLILWWPS